MSDSSKTKTYLLPLALVLCFVGCSTSHLTPESKTTVDPYQIDATLLAHKPEFRTCYEEQRTKASGRILAEFVIGSDGKVTKKAIKSSTLNQPKVEECVLNTIQKIQFAAPGHGLTIHVAYPFRFYQ